MPFCGDCPEATSFNKRLILQRRKAISDDRGGVVQVWVFESMVWAILQPLRGRERWLADQVHSDVTHRAQCRWFPALTSDGFRFIHDGRIFNIQSVLDVDEAHDLYELLLIETAVTEEDEVYVLPPRHDFG